MKSRGVGVVGVVALLAGCASSPSAAEQQAKAAEIREALSTVVTYEVVGDTTQASVTMTTPSGTTQGSDIDVPMIHKDGTKVAYRFQAGASVYLSAQNSKDSGSVTCRIWSGPDVVSENTASGAYAIATCKGNA